jgi:hypothetical protein
LRSTGDGRDFCCRKSFECKGLRRFRIRLLFSIGFLDAAEVIAMDAYAGCVKIVRRAETAQGTWEKLGGGQAMRKNIGVLLILVVCASTLSLSGCFYQRAAGPCYGVGCSVLSHGGAPKTATLPQPASGNTTAQNGAAPAAGASSTASSAQSSQAVGAPADASQSDAGQEQPGVFTRMLTALHLHSKS